MFKDYYAILGVSLNATNEDIKRAFREQAIRWHPDRNQGVDTTIQMQEINEAYLILKDKEARMLYDIEYNNFKQYQKQTGEQYKGYSFEVENDLLRKWMANAKKQSVELAKQTINDFKGVTKAAATGCLDGVILLVIWIVIINLIYFIFRTYSN